MRTATLVALAIAAGLATAAALAAPAHATPEPITTLSPAPAGPAPAPVAPPAPAAPTPAPPATPVVAPAAGAPTAAAIKPPSFEVLDRGDAVEVIAHNIKAARTAIVPIRSRLEVPIVGAPIAKRATPTDATVKLIELDGADAARSLSVKLGFERADVKALARFAQAIQVGDDLHVLIPRRLPADGTAPRLPEPTVPAELAAAVARLAPPAIAEVRAIGPPAASRDATSPGAVTPQPALDRPSDVGPAANADANHTTAADTRPAVASTSERKRLAQTLAPDTDDWSKISMYAAIGLAAAGIGTWLMRRRRGQVAPPASIEIIAQRSLGGKARIVWLSAGPREMIVSVTAQQVRMLGQWRKADATASLPAAHTHADPRPITRARTSNDAFEDPPRGSGEIPLADKPVSPAVTGILRLRGRTGQMPVAVPDDGGGDVVADELWAKEILAATGARR